MRREKQKVSEFESQPNKLGFRGLNAASSSQPSLSPLSKPSQSSKPSSSKPTQHYRRDGKLDACDDLLLQARGNHRACRFLSRLPGGLETTPAVPSVATSFFHPLCFREFVGNRGAGLPEFRHRDGVGHDVAGVTG